MRKIVRFILYASSILMTGACDSKEDVYFVGERPSESDILKVDKPRLYFSPEGETQDIQISSITSWEAVIDDNTGMFSLDSSPTGKGNGVISVKANSNTSSTTYEASLQVRPVGFDSAPISVQLSQRNVTLKVVTLPTAEVKPEEGDTVWFSINSSIDWKLEPVSVGGSIGNLEWFEDSSLLTGEGNISGVPQDIILKWKPNYTQMQRSITLQLKPISLIAFNDLPFFTLKQEAGTLPVVNSAVNVDIVNATVSWEYTSWSPVKECGVMLYKLEGSSEILNHTYIPDQSVGGFEKSHRYTNVFTDLDETTRYKAVPFVVNEVGRSEQSVEFITDLRPENRRYKGVSIEGEVEVVTDDVSATITVNVTSDVEPLGNNRIASAVMNFGSDNRTVDGELKSSESIAEGTLRYQYVFSTSSFGVLIPNKEYSYNIRITGEQLPDDKGQVVNKETTISNSFKTMGKIPVIDDNSKPDVGN